MSELVEGIHWVGIVDWFLRQFHGYTVPDGATYNSYLILDEQLTLIDSVRESYGQDLVNKVNNLIGSVKKLKYLVSLHSEPDHSGSIARIYNENPDITIVCSVPAKACLQNYYSDLL